jgi:hypothetical protein
MADTITTDQLKEAQKVLEEYKTAAGKSLISKEQVDKAQEIINEYARQVSKVGASTVTAMGAMATGVFAAIDETVKQTFSSWIKEAEKASQGVTDSLKNIDGTLDSFEKKFQNFLSADSLMSKIGGAIIKVRIQAQYEKFDEIGKFATNRVGKENRTALGLEDQWNATKDQWKAASSTLGLGGVAESAKKMFPNLAKEIDGYATAGAKAGQTSSGLADAIGNLVSQNLRAADAQADLRQHFFDTAAASGQLGKVLTSTGYSQDFMDKTAQAYSQTIEKAAKSTNQSHASMMGLSDQLMRLPSVLGDTSNGFSHLAESVQMGTNSVSALEAAEIVAKGTGQSYAAVISEMTDAVNNYNANSQQATEYVARIGEASNKTGIALSTTKDIFATIGSQMGLLGNQTEASTKIVDQLGTAFSKMGLSAEQTKGMITGVTAGIANMSMAQKAFIAEQSGMGGGLAGAYKIEDMIRKGNTAELMNMVKDSFLKQTGGKAMTIEERQAGGEAAAQRYYAQQQMIGQAFNIQDGAKQQALLEAFAKGKTSEIKSALDLLGGASGVSTVAAQRKGERESVFTGAAQDNSKMANASREAAAATAESMVRLGDESSRTSDILGKFSNNLDSANQVMSNLRTGQYSAKTVNERFAEGVADQGRGMIRTVRNTAKKFDEGTGISRIHSDWEAAQQQSREQINRTSETKKISDKYSAIAAGIGSGVGKSRPNPVDRVASAPKPYTAALAERPTGNIPTTVASAATTIASTKGNQTEVTARQNQSQEPIKLEVKTEHTGICMECGKKTHANGVTTVNPSMR